MRTYRPASAALFAILLAAGAARAQTGGTFDLTWNTFDCGGGTSTGGTFELRGTIGQPDAGAETGGTLECDGGFWNPALVGSSCYANCDQSTALPFLNVNDFVCFQSAFAAGLPYANCDHSTAPPVLNVNDFVCFQSAFAAGCSAP